MTLDNIKAAIVSGKFDMDQVREIEQAVRFAKGQATKSFKRELAVGVDVQFLAGPRRGMWTGTVKKVNIKRAQVYVPAKATTYTVPISMLEIV